MLQQPLDFLTNEYYNPGKLRLTKIKINEFFTAKIFHNMKKLYKILFLGGGGRSNFPGGRQFSGGNFPGGLFAGGGGGNFPGGTFPWGILPA